MQGYVQSSALLSTGYAADGGKVYAYFTYNNTPGGILVLEDAAGQTEAKISNLYVPEESLAQYCLCSPICDSDGTLYYNNDSGNLVAIGRDSSEPMPPEPLRFTDVDYSSWYAPGVDFVAGRGLMKGYEGTTIFGVGSALTRGELATILWRNACPDEAAAYDPATAKDATGIAGLRGRHVLHRRRELGGREGRHHRH